MGANMERSGGWLVWVALAVAVGSAVYSHLRLRAVEAELDVRPPIAVIDISRVATEAQQTDTRADFNARLTRARDAVQRLSDAGYVVLERNQVEGYPVALEVKP
jgi:hypothetical protein